MAGKTIATAPRAVTKSIEDLRVGDWVLADNPQLTARERAEAKEAQRPQDDPSRWRRISMRLHKESGGHVDIELLRPLAWLETHQVAIGEKVNLELTELAVAGWADVFRIDACPPIGPPPSPGCRVVTGHYAHSATSTLDLRIAGISGQPGQTIGVTATHPIWSVEEDDFVAAGDLLVGEQLLTADGLITSVLEIAPRPGEELVFNLEVDVEHVYFVSPAGLLVHNATVLCHAGSKLSTKPNHVYEIRDKLTGQVYKYGISSGKIGLNGQSYRATRQVNALNRAAGYNRYESRIIGRNLTRSKALSMEQGRVNGYSVARQRAGATNRQGPVGNKLPQPTR